MAILAGLASILGRFAGRLLNTTLGWASILLFGKVPQQKQTLLLMIVLGSLGWVALVVGVIVPDVGSVLIAFVPLPDFVEEGWVRLAMLAGALLLPLVIGAATIFVTAAEQRPKGAALIKTVLRGYPFTIVLAVTIVILAAVATTRRLRALSKHWQDTHVPVIVKPGAYEQVLRLIHEVLGRAGMDLTIREAPKMVSLPPRMLDWAAGGLGALVPDNLMVLSSADLELLVYPSDLAISGTQAKVAAARAAVVSSLTHAPAYMTYSKQAQDFEDDIEQASKSGLDEASLAELDRRLASLTVQFEEWDTLYRERLQLEHDLTPAASTGARRVTVGQVGSRAPTRLGWAVGLGGLGLVLLDVTLLLSNRRSRPR